MPFKSIDIAYLAGLYEGEGTLHVARYYWVNGEKRLRKTPQPKMRITMTDKEPLERVQKTIGGRINGPYQYKKGPESVEHYKQFWILEFDSPGFVREICSSIKKYLSPRRLSQLQEVYDSIQK